ncbi:MAG: nuclear transport factor 2 family protein [Deltaproteobacteria bacterium]|nr:nuclear transport factor 2 family protein [Deltaproteobacteria bacterium]
MTPEDLVEIELIKQLKYKYMRCVDRKLWSELSECFTGDATCAYSGGKYAHEGRDAICAWLEGSMSADSFHSSHRVHHPEIQLTGPTTATGTWALEDTVIETKLGFTLRGAAFYEDRYVKEDGSWKIEHTGYQRSYEEMQTRKDVPGLTLTASAWSTGGRSVIDA